MTSHRLHPFTVHGLSTGPHRLSLRFIPNAIAVALAAHLGMAMADAPSPDAEPGAVTHHSHLHGADSVQAKPKKVRDPLVVDPSTAVRDTPAKEIELPGVMTVPGEVAQALDPLRAKVISMSESTNAMVYLSSDSDNRIQLPFTNPFIRHNSDINIEVNKGANGLPGNFVYVGFAVKRPVQIFIEPPDGSASLGLRLIPKEIPSQTIVVKDETGITSPELRRANKSNEYVTQVQSTMEIVAKHGVPNGFSVVDMEIPTISMNGLIVETLKRMSSRNSDIYLYRVTNPGPAGALLSETEFDGDLVQAVSIYPKPRVAVGQSVEVIVMASKRRVASAPNTLQ